MKTFFAVLRVTFLSFFAVLVATIPLVTAVYAESVPYLTLSSFSGHPGQILAIQGGGYSGNEGLTLLLNGVDSNASVTTDSFGNWGPVSLQIPVNAPQGPVSIKGVSKATNGEQASNVYYVTPFTPSVKASSTTNTPYSTMTVSGNGYFGGEDVLITLGSSSTTVKTDSLGNFTGATLTIPNVSSATYVVTGKGLQSGSSGIDYFYISGFFPNIWPSSYYILPGQTLTFSGSGFASTEKINVYIGKSLVPTTNFVTDVNGAFAAAGSIIIPASASDSSLLFTLKGGVSGASSNVTVPVGSYHPSISQSLYYILPGDNLSFSGSGFAPSDVVTVYEGNTTKVLGTISVDVNGNFVNGGAFTIPFSYTKAPQLLTFSAPASAKTLNLTINVSKPYTQISASLGYVKPGQSFNITGSGYGANESLLLNGDGLAGVTGIADNMGNVLFKNVVLPFVNSNTFNFNVAGVVSSYTAANSLTVGQYYPSLSASEYYVVPGSTITFSGFDFAPNEVIDVTTGTGLTKTLITTTNTNAKGLLTLADFNVGYGKGSLTYTFTGKSSNAAAVITITLAQIYPSVGSDNYYALPGSTVNLTGNGFLPSENVDVIVGGITKTVPTDKFGSTGLVPTVLPFGGLNTRVVEMRGQLSEADVTTTITLAPFMPGVDPSSWYLNPGSAINFTGHEFASNETVTVSMDKIVLGTLTTNATGGFISSDYTAPFKVDNATYTFSGNLSKTNLTVTVGIAKLYSSLQLDNYYGIGGSPVTVIGSSFYANENVNIKFGSVDLGNVKANALGNISFPTTVPYSVEGPKDVVATGLTSGTSAMTTFTQAPVYVNLQLGQYYGMQGVDKINFIGSNYMPNETLTLTTDKTTGSQYTFVSNANGNFNDKALTIPLSFPEGNLTLTVTGSKSFAPRSIVIYIQKA